MNTYQVCEGKHNKIMENVFLSIIKNLNFIDFSVYSECRFRIIGSTALYLARKTNFSDCTVSDNYKYLQTVLQNKNNGENIIKNREIDLVVSTRTSYTYLKRVLSSFGKINVKEITMLDSIFGFVINKDIQFCEKIELIITSSDENKENSESPDFEDNIKNIFSRTLFDILGEVKLVFNVICLCGNWNSMKQWVIPVLSKNFYFEYYDSSIRFGEITNYKDSIQSLDKPCSLLSMIKSLEFINYIYHNNNEIGYSNSGDKIFRFTDILDNFSYEERHRLFQTDFNYKYNYEFLKMKPVNGITMFQNERIKYALEGGNMYLYSFLKLKSVSYKKIKKSFLLNNLKLEKSACKRVLNDLKNNTDCSICLEKIKNDYRNIYVTSCGHLYHINCLITGILKMYYDYYYALEKRIENIIEYDISGNIVRGQKFNCPNCRKDLFNIPINKKNIKHKLYSNYQSDYIFSNRSFKTKTPFKFEF